MSDGSILLNEVNHGQYSHLNTESENRVIRV